MGKKPKKEVTAIELGEEVVTTGTLNHNEGGEFIQQPLKLYRVFEIVRTDGGYIELPIVIRYYEEDAKKVIRVLEDTDTFFKQYGYREIVDGCTTAEPGWRTFIRRIFKF